MTPYKMYDKYPIRKKVWSRAINEIIACIAVLIILYSTGYVVYWLTRLVIAWKLP